MPETTTGERRAAADETAEIGTAWHTFG